MHFQVFSWCPWLFCISRIFSVFSCFPWHFHWFPKKRQGAGCLSTKASHSNSVISEEFWWFLYLGGVLLPPYYLRRNFPPKKVTKLNFLNTSQGVFKNQKARQKTCQSTYLNEYMLFKKSHQTILCSHRNIMILVSLFFFREKTDFGWCETSFFKKIPPLVMFRSGTRGGGFS